MELTEINLSGFKSFVDPTSVKLPSHLVAIVGPNGCGKSNIIDAIQWVMGESSAKQLRGESLTDVIFNGSGNRKPVGQASVELVFDNHDSTMGGEYSKYAEIAIKRVITRDSESTYYLNGVRCRRRDITDIFLGTGLGPRSYSIIGQNMISRLIEAKPDDMRIYLEEAAGISKYKERRRETENRIRHTKENLARLNDLRAELEKQLNTLNRQANAAERFKILKQEERNLRAQWYAIQWRQFDSRLVQYTLQVQQQETGVEARHAELTQIDRSLETKRDEHQVATEAFHEVQRRYYAAGNEITRMEQEIRHHQERQHEWQAELERVESEWQTALQQMEEMEEQLRELAEDITMLEPQTEKARLASRAAISDLTAVEEATQMWQTNWDEFNQHSAKTMQYAQVEQTRIQHLEQKLATLKQQQAKFTQEQSHNNFTDIERELVSLDQEVQEAIAQTETHQQHLEDVREQLSSKQINEREMINQLDQVRSELQQLRGQEASLQALQQTALGQRNQHLSAWLAENHLEKSPRLAQGVEVQAGWETAVEKALGTSLQAICVDDLSAVAAKALQLKEGSVSVFGTAAVKSAYANKATSLLSKVTSKWPLDSLLSGIYIADTLADALALISSLEPHESVITPDGVWMGSSWLRLSRDEDPAAGIFQREQELKQLAQRIEEKSERQESLQTQLEDIHAQLQTLEQQREELQKSANAAHAQASEVQARERVKRERLQDIKARAELVANELNECLTQMGEAQEELTLTRANWQNAMSDLEKQADKREEILNERELVRNKLQAARDLVNLTKDEESQVQIRLQTSQSQEGVLKQSMLRLQTQLTSLAKRKTTLEDELSGATSVEDLESTLGKSLEHRLAIEAQLNTTRATMEGLDHAMRELETRRQAIERELSKLRDLLETLRLECQSFKVKSENLIEQINEIGLALQDILQTLPDDATPEDWHAQLEQVTQRIARLGPINLVAIEEFATCSERKEYLDKQNNDLVEGLTTLEDAIAKIDKETRAKFKETFDKVNGRFNELFPAIFGGGRAYLELTGENLLDAGVTVMACPPGKRNSTIHLLSGGEKALTAIALVFSIFHLNPAPFCLLDEVDAPLDDANISRFCKLVLDMSEKTQFIFISHNKLAIEMGKHLIGVTMNEPGVSRLVSVNVEEAITLAGI